MFFGLRDFQTRGAHFLGENRHAALFFDCGLGKTLTTLASIHHYSADFLPALIVAPLRVAKTVWPVEVVKWGFPLSVSVAAGVGKRSQQKRLASDADITIINPESLRNVEVSRWRSVIFDESTYFKNCESKRWQAAMHVCQSADRVVLLTGTPIAGRGHLDLWGQFGLFGGSNPLGSWWEFTQRHFTFDIFNRPKLLKGHDEILNSLIAPYVMRCSIDEVKMPEFVEIDEVVNLPAAVMKKYTALKLEENSYAPMRTMASGFEYAKHWSGAVHPTWHHQAKLDAVNEIRSSTADNLLIFANFTAGIEALKSQLGCPSIDGSVASSESSRLVDAWNAGRLDNLVLHPRSGGHGLNLQQGGRRIIWFDLPDSGELWTQANARLHRSGQESSTVFCHKIMAAGTIDIQINKLLAKKCLNEQNLLAAVR